MRIAFTPPTENEFKQLFLSSPLRKGGGLDDISVFQPKGLAYRRGSGILSFISGVAKRVLPFIIKAVKPTAKEFGSAVIKDVIAGDKPIRNSLKRNGVKALKQTGLRLIRGSGGVNKRLEGSGGKKKTKKRNSRYKRDIFDMI